MDCWRDRGRSMLTSLDWNSFYHGRLVLVLVVAVAVICLPVVAKFKVFWAARSIGWRWFCCCCWHDEPIIRRCLYGGREDGRCSTEMKNSARLSPSWNTSNTLMECCCCYLLALDHGSYATSLGETSISQVTECYFGFVKQKSNWSIVGVLLPTLGRRKVNV